jgi:hypothetical protein
MIYVGMPAKSDSKNINNGSRLAVLKMTQELNQLREVNISLQKEIDMPSRFSQSIKKEHEFIEVYSSMDNEQKNKIQDTFCDRCVRFTKNMNSGESFTGADDMECFAGFFGMCICMWRRYVVRIYHAQIQDPFDMNEDYKKERYEEISRDAIRKKMINQKRISVLLRMIYDTNEKLNGNEDVRKKVEWEKKNCCAVLGDVETQRRLDERAKQAAKNIAKMKEMKLRKTKYN